LILNAAEEEEEEVGISGVGRRGCKVGQGVSEVDAAGELISHLDIQSAIKQVLTFQPSNAGKEASRSQDFNLPSHFATR